MLMKSERQNKMADVRAVDKNGDSYVIFKDTVISPDKWGLYKVSWGGANTLIDHFESEAQAFDAFHTL